jgi:hypothetical protein
MEVVEKAVLPLSSSYSYYVVACYPSWVLPVFGHVRVGRLIAPILIQQNVFRYQEVKMKMMTEAEAEAEAETGRTT